MYGPGSLTPSAGMKQLRCPFQPLWSHLLLIWRRIRLRTPQSLTSHLNCTVIPLPAPSFIREQYAHFTGRGDGIQHTHVQLNPGEAS